MDYLALESCSEQSFFHQSDELMIEARCVSSAGAGKPATALPYTCNNLINIGYIYIYIFFFSSPLKKWLFKVTNTMPDKHAVVMVKFILHGGKLGLNKKLKMHKCRAMKRTME